MPSARALVAIGVLVLGAATAVRTQAPPAQGPAAPAGGGAARGRGAAPAGGALPDPAAAARGQQMVATQCAACHGADGRGGPFGGDLAQSAIAVANDGGAGLAAFLRVGRPEMRMPPLAVSDADAADLSAFLRTLPPPAAAGGRGAIAALVVGDARAGETYFNTSGCTTCHSVTGDLKGIGARYDVATIQGRAVMPRGSGGYPRSFRSPPPADEAPRTVTITQPSGEQTSGTLVWITDFWVTFDDDAGVRRTVTRDGEVPRVKVTDPLAWHIEHMKRLTDGDMHNLTAYLVTLR